MSGIANAVGKALTPAFYVQSWKTFLERSHNYYHPLMKSGSVKPLWHMMFAISAIMYTASYSARDYKAVQHRHAIEKDAMHEYYDKHGGAPGHH
jgi:hypothetical protein|mmetsp:Transcript_4480/g.10842  ORF Transcript_4480/g.10842 Transcript_4480/m.10842 type:complete len:94 (+) Transcript_4480:64-345(+)